MKKIANFLSWVIIIVLVIDLMGFLSWALSGQIPEGNFYIGSITKHALQWAINL